MIYKQQEPTFNLKNIVKSFWLIDSENDTTIRQEKIIPDGYPEFIFHYNDSYSANVLGSWFEQEKYLVAGQIKNHFFLENTGKIGMFGIKFQPWALKLLFDLDMHLLSNTVIGISEPLQKSIKPVIGGLGVSILSTNKGLLTNRKAKELGVGGELLCTVW